MPWRLPATPCLTLPEAVKRKRFLAPLLVFILGIFVPFQRVTIGSRGNALLGQAAEEARLYRAHLDHASIVPMAHLDGAGGPVDEMGDSDRLTSGFGPNSEYRADGEVHQNRLRNIKACHAA